MPTTTVLGPYERQRAVHRLRLLNKKINVYATTEEIALVLAEVLQVPCPDNTHRRSRMIRHWLSELPLSSGFESRPWKALELSPMMRRALDRAADPYRRFPGDGRGDVEVSLPEVQP